MLLLKFLSVGTTGMSGHVTVEDTEGYNSLMTPQAKV